MYMFSLYFEKEKIFFPLQGSFNDAKIVRKAPSKMKG